MGGPGLVVNKPSHVMQWSVTSPSASISDRLEWRLMLIAATCSKYQTFLSLLFLFVFPVQKRGEEREIKKKTTTKSEMRGGGREDQKIE